MEQWELPTDADVDDLYEAEEEGNEQERQQRKQKGEQAEREAAARVVPKTLVTNAAKAAAMAPGAPPAPAGGAVAGAGAASSASGGAGAVAAAVAPPVAAPPAAVGDVLDAILAGTTAAPAAPVQAHPINDVAEIKKLALQLEARMRAAEHSLYTMCFLPVGHQGVQLALAADAGWRTAALANPAGHGLGGGEGLRCAAFLRGAILEAVPVGTDTGVLARRAALVLVYAHLRQLDQIQVAELCTHFSVAPLEGNRKGQAIVAWKLDGRISPPPGAGQLDACDVAISAAFASDSIAPLMGIIPRSFTTIHGEFLPATAPGISLDKVLLGYLCTTGGSRSNGKAPPSAQARRVRGKGKGKGRGKNAPGA